MFLFLEKIYITRKESDIRKDVRNLYRLKRENEVNKNRVIVDV